jgi:hypothetical protein
MKHRVQPGTAAFVATVETRNDTSEIARQVIESGTAVIWRVASASSCPQASRAATVRARARTA